MQLFVIWDPTQLTVLATMRNLQYFDNTGGPGSSVGIVTELRAGRSGDRIPVLGETFHICSDRSWGPPSLLYNGYWVFLGGK